MTPEELAYKNFKDEAVEYIRTQTGEHLTWEDMMARLRTFKDNPQGVLENEIDSCMGTSLDQPYRDYIEAQIDHEFNL